MESQEKKKYIPPEIIFETDLETKAGTPNSPIVPGGSELDIFPGGEG